MERTKKVSSEPKEATKKSKPRIRSITEEVAFIIGLKLLVVNGWKTDNGFKTGYLNVLLEHMQKTFPGIDIKTKPHIESKIHTWKKTHGFLVSLTGKTGVNWDDEKKQVLCSEEIWDHHAKTLRGMDGKRLSSWPYFDNWCIIFGKDRANGYGGKDFADAVNKVMESEKQQTNKKESDDVYVSLYEDNTPVHVHTPQDEVASTVVTKKLKVTEVEKSDDRFISTMNGFMERSEANMSVVVAAVAPDPAIGGSRKLLWDALGVFPELDLDIKVVVGEKLADNPGKMEYFFSLPEEARLVLARRIKSAGLSVVSDKK